MGLVEPNPRGREGVTYQGIGWLVQLDNYKRRMCDVRAERLIAQSDVKKGCRVHVFFHGNVNGDPFGHKMEQDTRWLFETLRLGYACGKCDNLYYMNVRR